MDTVIVAVTQYLIWVMAAGFAVMWLLVEDRRGKVALGASAVLGLALTLVFIKFAGAMYDAPRPFVPVALGGDGATALIDHAPDNGFPSNHSAAAGLIAALILLRHWRWGLLFATAAAAVAWSRVAAHVHHLLDVTAGLGLGALAAVIGTLLAWLLLGRTPLADWPPLARLVNEAKPERRQG